MEHSEEQPTGRIREHEVQAADSLVSGIFAVKHFLTPDSAFLGLPETTRFFRSPGVRRIKRLTPLTSSEC